MIGSIPGVFIGARFSSRAPDYLIRPALIVVLALSGLKLVGVSNKVLGVVVPIAIAGGVGYALLAWRRARRLRAAHAQGASHATSAAVGISGAPTTAPAGAADRTPA